MGLGELIIIFLIALAVVVYPAYMERVKEKEKRKKQIEADIERIYKAEPKILKVDKSPEAIMPDGNFIVAKTKVGATPRKLKAQKAKPAKVKKSWYNNGTEQKLIPSDQDIETGWVKGKLPKGDK